MGIKYRDNNTIKDISIKVGDNIPVGAEFDYNGQTIPAGYEEVTGSSGTRIKKVSSTAPTTGQVVDSLSSNSTTDAPNNCETFVTLEYTKTTD